MIKYIKGDLFTTKADIIAHGVNCQNGFGSGIAKQIANRFPNVKKAYHKRFEELGWELGDVQLIGATKHLYIANCATQDRFLPRGICHASYPAIEKAMRQLKQFAQQSNKTIAIPKIGAGLAGGDWNKIESIINKVFDDYEILCYTLE